MRLPSVARSLVGSLRGSKAGDVDLETNRNLLNDDVGSDGEAVYLSPVSFPCISPHARKSVCCGCHL